MKLLPQLCNAIYEAANSAIVARTDAATLQQRIDTICSEFAREDVDLGVYKIAVKAVDGHLQLDFGTVGEHNQQFERQFAAEWANVLLRALMAAERRLTRILDKVNQQLDAKALVPVGELRNEHGFALVVTKDSITATIDGQTATWPIPKGTPA